MQLPPPEVIGAIVQRYARLMSRFGDELGERPLVLPNNEFFPDEFRSNERALKRLVKRMQRHADMTDIPVETRLLEESGGCADCGPGGCGSGKSQGDCACGHAGDHAGHDHEPPPRLVDQGDSWVIQIPESETKHPVVLTTNVARSLGYVFLMETRADGEAIDPPVDVTADLAAVALGFGVLLLEGSYIYQKSCRGPAIGRVTKLGTGELSIATALFAARAGQSTRAARKELGTTQRSVFAEAEAWADSNRELVELLRSQPSELTRGDFQMTEPEPWLLRLIGRKKRARIKLGDPSDAFLGASLEELESMLSAMPAPAPRKASPPDPKREELKALVDEALGSSGAD
jgi:hypothetical protein